MRYEFIAQPRNWRHLRITAMEHRIQLDPKRKSAYDHSLPALPPAQPQCRPVRPRGTVAVVVFALYGLFVPFCGYAVSYCLGP